MARTAQALSIGDGTANNFTVIDQSVFQRDPESPIQPKGIVAFRGSFTLDGSGVGDTADCRITFPLPGTDFYQLHAWQCAIEGSTDYTDGTMELYYATKPVDFGLTTQADFPTTRSLARRNIGTSGDTVVNILLGAFFDTTFRGVDQLPLEQSPFRYLQTGAAGGGTDPVLWLSGGSATEIDSGTCRLTISFLRYSVEQFLAAPLYTGLSQR